MISKTKIAQRVSRKNDPEVVETLILAKKNEAWKKTAQQLSGSRREYASVNLQLIDEKAKAGDTVVVPGKVLGAGELTKKVKICAMQFSESAAKKLEEGKHETTTILEEIKKNPEAKGVVIVR